MRKLMTWITAVILMAAFAACNNVDPIYNDDPVDISFWSGQSDTSSFDLGHFNQLGSTGNNDAQIAMVGDFSDEPTYFPLDEFKALGEKGDTTAQRAMVDKYRKALTANVVRHYPQIRDEKNIRFLIGSGYAKNVLTRSGKTHSGKFRNELIIVINDPSVKDTIFLACGNGMLSPIEDLEYSDAGSAEQWRFTILPGEGLAHHLPELQAWAEVANNLSIPIRNSNGKVVSQETYLNYLGRYESVLFPYDVIDVLNGKVYNQAGQEVNFESRLAETDKANAKIAKSKAKPKSKTKARRRK